jgi:glyoxylase-like metal-dependent hydrolase (beta-lactamase superfamily II)
MRRLIIYNQTRKSCYGKKIYLIDSGVASSEQIIFDYIRQTGRNPDEISMIVLTHSHPDHIEKRKGSED